MCMPNMKYQVSIFTGTEAKAKVKVADKQTNKHTHKQTDWTKTICPQICIWWELGRRGIKMCMNPLFRSQQKFHATDSNIHSCIILIVWCSNQCISDASFCCFRSSGMKFSTVQQAVIPRKLAISDNAVNKTQTGNSLLQKMKEAPCYNMEQVRTKVRYHYFPRALKRMNKFGLEKRLSSKNGRKILFNKFIKGKHTLSTFDRFPNQLPGQPYRNSQRINLFDRRMGYKKPRKPEHYRF